MDTTRGLAAILRDAAKTPLLRMRSEIASQPLRMTLDMLANVSAAAVDISRNKYVSFGK
jgi:hypothetical protein